MSDNNIYTLVNNYSPQTHVILQANINLGFATIDPNYYYYERLVCIDNPFLNTLVVGPGIEYCEMPENEVWSPMSAMIELSQGQPMSTSIFIGAGISDTALSALGRNVMDPPYMFFDPGGSGFLENSFSTPLVMGTMVASKIGVNGGIYKLQNQMIVDSYNDQTFPLKYKLWEAVEGYKSPFIWVKYAGATPLDKPLVIYLVCRREKKAV